MKIFKNKEEALNQLSKLDYEVLEKLAELSLNKSAIKKIKNPTTYSMLKAML